MGLISRVSSRTYRKPKFGCLAIMGGGAQFYDKAPELLDFEKARAAGVKLSPFDEQRLRNHQLRRARRMYLNTLKLSDREPLWKFGPHGIRPDEFYGRTKSYFNKELC